MKYFLRAFLAEGRKQHRVYFHGPVIYFSMGLWPILNVLTAFYMFRPFTEGNSNIEALKIHLGTESVEAFLLIGFLGYNFFYSLVQAAWRFSFERFDGTLELIFLTPANRFAVILGNATAVLLESMWLFTIFTALVYFGWLNEWKSANIWLLPVATIIMAVAAVAWGALLNSLFLLTRDTGFLYTIIQEPLRFFSGVQFPVSLFTSWIQVISYAFPLTYCLIILRQVALSNASFQTIWPEVAALVVIIILLLAVSYWLLNVAERRAKQTGSLTLF